MRIRCLGLVCFAALLANGQELDLPWGPVKRLASLDGSKVLYGVWNSKGREAPQLWIEDTRTHHRTKLFDIGSTLSAAWSADGAKFFVNDHLASSSELAYIYDAATLKRMDIAAIIQAADPQSRLFPNAHTYFEIGRWEGTQDVAVRFFGHTDEPPVRCFAFRYRISRAGVVTGISQRIAPITAKHCEG